MANSERSNTAFKRRRQDCWSENAELWTAFVDEDKDRDQVFRELLRRVAACFGATQLRTFLDLGCGEGYFLRLVHDKYPDARLVGVDYCQQMLRLARERSAMLRIEYIQGDYEEPHPLPIDGTFDVVTAVLSFIESDDLRQAFSHFSSRLSPSGIGVVVALDELTDMIRFHLGGLPDATLEQHSESSEYFLSSRFRVRRQMSPQPYFRFLRNADLYEQLAKQAGLELASRVTVVGRERAPLPPPKYSLMLFARQPQR